MKHADADEQATARITDSGFNGVPWRACVNVELRKCLRTMEVGWRKQIFSAIMTLKAEMLEKPVGDRWQHVELKSDRLSTKKNVVDCAREVGHETTWGGREKDAPTKGDRLGL